MISPARARSNDWRRQVALTVALHVFVAIVAGGLFLAKPRTGYFPFLALLLLALSALAVARQVLRHPLAIYLVIVLMALSPRLRLGTPLELLAMSTPGVGSTWMDDDSPTSPFHAVALGRDAGSISYCYLGMLTLPLACMGLVVGRRTSPLIAMSSLVLILSAFSRRSVLVGFGLFALIVMAAAVGAESMLSVRRRRRWILFALFVLNGVASLLWLIVLQGRAAVDSYIFGVAAALLLLYSIALARFALARTSADARHAFVVLLFLTWLDTSTVAFAHVRLALARTVTEISEPDRRCG